ncbi:hypothetical protein ABZ366_23795 [Streptomyces sp. NPDC005904]
MSPDVSVVICVYTEDRWVRVERVVGEDGEARAGLQDEGEAVEVQR